MVRWICARNLDSVALRELGFLKFLSQRKLLLGIAIHSNVRLATSEAANPLLEFTVAVCMKLHLLLERCIFARWYSFAAGDLHSQCCTRVVADVR